MVVISAKCMKTMCKEVGMRGKKTKYTPPKKTKSAPKKTRKTRSDKGKSRVRRTKKEVSESKKMGGEDKPKPKGRKKRSDTGKKRGKRLKKTGKGNVKMTIKKKPKTKKKKKMLMIKDKPMGSAEAFTKFGGYASLNVNLNPTPFIGNVAGQSSVGAIVPFVAPPRSRSNGKLTVRGKKQLTASKPKGMITRAECNRKIKQALRSR